MKAIISHLNGIFWLRYQDQKMQVPIQETTSYQRLVDWVEEYFVEKTEIEIVYNFSPDILPKNELDLIKAPRFHEASQEIEAPAPKPVPLFVFPQQKQYRQTITCKHCGKSFERALWYSKADFCSRTCAAEHRRTLSSHKEIVIVNLSCSYCKSSFERAKKSCNGGITKAVFCQPKCKNQYYSERMSKNSNV